MKRNIMRQFRIDEISGVDTPAQEPATVSIMKRAEPESLKKYGVVALTSEADGHQHGVQIRKDNCWCGCDGQATLWVDYSSDTDGDSHTHPVATNTMDIGTSIGHTHEIEGAALLAAELQKAGGDCKMTTKNDDQTTDEPTVTLESLTAENARLNSILGLSTEERAHFDALPEEMRTSFLGKSAADRQAEIVAKNAADPVVYTTIDGVEIRKSAGDAMLSLAKSNDALRKSNDDLVKAQEQATLEKRAETELSHIPGDIQTRAAMLKSIEGITDETLRQNAMSALRSQNEIGKSAFTTIGSMGGSFEAGSAEESLDKLAKGIMEKENIEYAVAYSKAMTSAEGRELYAKSVREAANR